MTNHGDLPDELIPAWQDLRQSLRAFFARRVPASEVDDLLAECAVKVVEGLPALQDRERLGAWVFQIARNLVVDHLRRRQREPRHESLADAGAEAVDEENGARDEHCTVAGWLEAFVDRLPPRYALAMRLSELEQRSHREIAARLGLSVSGIKSRVQRGRALLRADLLACCRIEFDRRGRVVDHERLRRS